MDMEEYNEYAILKNMGEEVQLLDLLFIRIYDKPKYLKSDKTYLNEFPEEVREIVTENILELERFIGEEGYEDKKILYKALESFHISNEKDEYYIKSNQLLMQGNLTQKVKERITTLMKLDAMFENESLENLDDDLKVTELELVNLTSPNITNFHSEWKCFSVSDLIKSIDLLDYRLDEETIERTRIKQTLKNEKLPKIKEVHGEMKTYVVIKDYDFNYKNRNYEKTLEYMVVVFEETPDSKSICKEFYILTTPYKLPYISNLVYAC